MANGCGKPFGKVRPGLVRTYKFPSAELSLEHPTPLPCCVARAAVPQMAVENQRRAGLGEDKLLGGMTTLRLLHRLRHGPTHPVASRDQSCRAVAGREV